MKKITSLLSLLFIALVWHFMTAYKFIDPQFFPSPFAQIKRLVMLLGDYSFVYHCLRSFYRLLISTLISVPTAFLFAWLCSHKKSFDRLINPFMALTFPLPKVAILPLLLLIFGIGDAGKIATIALGMFYLLFIQLRHGMLKLIDSKNGDIVKIYKIQGMNYFSQVLCKGIYPDFLTGMKTAFGYGLTLVVVSEFSMSRDGIGNFIWKSWDQFRVLDMYAGVLFLCLFGFLLYMFFDFLSARARSRY